MRFYKKSVIKKYIIEVGQVDSLEVVIRKRSCGLGKVERILTVAWLIKILVVEWHRIHAWQRFFDGAFSLIFFCFRDFE